MAPIQEVLQFLTDAKLFYIATVENGTPKVRPFGFVMEFEGKLYFCTNNQKDIYRQLQANPELEISATSAGYQWIRLKGKAVFDKNSTAKVKAFEVSPALANMYKSSDNPIFEVFYLQNGEAAFYGINQEPRTVRL